MEEEQKNDVEETVDAESTEEEIVSTPEEDSDVEEVSDEA